jgi:hypothetical protein
MSLFSAERGQSERKQHLLLFTLNLRKADERKPAHSSNGKIDENYKILMERARAAARKGDFYESKRLALKAIGEETL